MIWIVLYLLSSLLTLALILKEEYDKGIDLKLGWFLLFVVVCLIPILNLAWLANFKEIVILKGKKQ